MSSRSRLREAAMSIAVATGGFVAIEAKNLLLYGGPRTADALWVRFTWFIGVAVPILWGGRYVFAQFADRRHVPK